MESEAFRALQDHYASRKDALDMRDMFGADAQRAEKMTIVVDGLLRLDYSKNVIDDRGLDLLHALGRAAGVEDRRDAMLRGDHINATEDRAVLHTALRAAPFLGEPGDWAAGLFVDEAPLVNAELARMADMCEAVHAGAWTGRGGKRFRHVVNIGIGGSDLGPAMATAALRPYWVDSGMAFHFVSNVDGTALAYVLAAVSLDETLFVVASKTFTTAETMRNAAAAAEALCAHYGVRDASERRAVVGAHFAAVSADTGRASAFGIDTARVVGFWDWVGGRYSLWSAVGLPLMLAVGPAAFRDFLRGAHALDGHFACAPAAANMPIVLGLLDVWYANVVGSSTRAVLPYEQLLARLPAYLQQADMESNGKCARLDGRALGLASMPGRAAASAGGAPDYATGSVVFGEPGTNGQHAFYQLLHQGTHVVPADFVVGLRPATRSSQVDMAAHHAVLFANCAAQAEALMAGGSTGTDAHRHFPGNRPSNMLVYASLTPAALGALLALYEHRVFVAGVVWGINSFDQWGVELGKRLAAAVERDLAPSDSKGSVHDASTTALIALYKAGSL